MSAHTMTPDGKTTQNGDMPLSAFGGGITDADDDTDDSHPGDYDYTAAIERGQRPWRDRDVLVYLRVEEAMSYRQIAGEAFDGAISGEGVRQAALSYDIEAERDPEDLSPRELALRYSAEKDDTDAPGGGDTYTKYTLREAIGNYLRFVNEYTHTIVRFRFRFRSAGGSMRPGSIPGRPMRLCGTTPMTRPYCAFGRTTAVSTSDDHADGGRPMSDAEAVVEETETSAGFKAIGEQRFFAEYFRAVRRARRRDEAPPQRRWALRNRRRPGIGRHGSEQPRSRGAGTLLGDGRRHRAEHLADAGHSRDGQEWRPR